METQNAFQIYIFLQAKFFTSKKIIKHQFSFILHNNNLFNILFIRHELHKSFFFKILSCQASISSLFVNNQLLYLQYAEQRDDVLNKFNFLFPFYALFNFLYAIRL